MKKNRNAFFTESNMQASGFVNPQMPQGNMNMPNMMPYNQASQSSSFYSGPANFYPGNTTNPNTDIDSRLSRIERQLNRLESRVNKLENTSNVTYNVEDSDISSNSNMYMI